MAYKDSLEAANRDIALQREQLDHEIDIKLMAAGWTRSCDYPGSYWLWARTFPESHIQYRFDKDRNKIPRPAQSVAGVSREIAIAMEEAWQQQYDDRREFSPTIEEQEAMEREG